MPINVTISYPVNIEGRMYKHYFNLRPDTDPVRNPSFNWVGSFDLNGEIIKVIIPQNNQMIDPKEEDFYLDPRIPISKQEIIEEIEKSLNEHLR